MHRRFLTSQLIILYSDKPEMDHSLPIKADTARKTVSLLDLPTELIEQILQDLPATDILNVLFVCRQINGVAKPLLYESITLRSPKSVQLLAQTLTTQSSPWVRSFTLEVGEEDERRYEEHYGQDIGVNYAQGEEDVRILGLLPKLEHLKIKRPYASYYELPRLFEHSESLQGTRG